MNRMFAGLVIVSYLILFCESNNRPAECELEYEIGPCRALIPAYYYNPSTDECLLFYYGGCSGNANRFETKTECESRCVNTTQRTNG